MGNYMWGVEKTIQLLNAVRTWEDGVKGTQPKWPWVATQLFVPDEESNLQRLSRRCERRFALMKTNYEVYCLQLTLFEGKYAQHAPSVKIDAELWKTMKSFFGDLKLKSTPSNVAVARALAHIRKYEKEDGVNDDQDYEDEPLDHPQREESLTSSSGSSVGSTHSFHDSAGTFTATPTRTSYGDYELASSEGYSGNSVALSDSRAMSTVPSLAYDQSFGSNSLADLSSSKTSSLYKSSSSGDSSGSSSLWKALEDVPESPVPALSTIKSTGKSSRSGVKTAQSQATNIRSLIDDLYSYNPFPKLDSASGPAGGSDHAEIEGELSRNISESTRSTEKSCSACCTSGIDCETCSERYCDTCSCGSSSSSSSSSSSVNKSSSPSISVRKPNSDSDTRGVSSHGTANGSSSSEHESSKTTPREVSVVYSSGRGHNEPQQLPESFANLKLDSSDRDDEPLGDEGRTRSLDDEQSQTSKSRSRDPAGSRQQSSSSSQSSGRDPSISTSTHGGMVDDNLNLTVYIKLNNLKVREAF